MNKNENGYILRIGKIIKAVDFLGGKCIYCNETNFIKLCFHHRDGQIDKLNDIAILKYRRWSTVEKELEKCDLLCQNCHYKIHEEIDIIKRTDIRFIKNKKIFLEYKNVTGCETCGYNENNSSLDFHHLENKKFIISRVFERNINSISDIPPIVIEELNKCIVLCKNCHKELEYDIDRFNKYKEIIYERIRNHKELPKKYDRELIKKLKSDGMSQIEISRKLGCSKSTVSMILKNT